MIKTIPTMKRAVTENLGVDNFDMLVSFLAGKPAATMADAVCQWLKPNPLRYLRGTFLTKTALLVSRSGTSYRLEDLFRRQS